MSPSYQTDNTTTDKDVLVNPSKMEPSSVRTMLTKVGLATLVGTAFVVGNSVGYSHTSTGITKTSVAYDELLGFELAEDGASTPSCSGAPKLFQKQCECANANCRSSYLGFVNGSSAALTCLKDNCLTGDSLTCFLTCFGKDKGPGGKELFQCLQSNKCLLF
eukprot:CAMPEP_0170778772 /NCGR_PEP_ID=MMETSP0733-20121128/12589_1 /TAXON_ID=186038 /ORGANISM="Fragilariopsis kerguelensis, Strain L26-C5" /LENGTH=161 /DNA_ID=CAMNT_0011122257 /DNA_START=65 /DNA_END=550 /DNA_ORIENTATION=-